MAITGLDFNTAPDLPEGTYRARLDSIEPEDGKDRDGNPTTYLRWGFTLNVDGEAVEYDALSSLKSGLKSKSYAFAKGLLGKDPSGIHLEFADLVGKSATAIVKNVTKPDGSAWPQIVDLLPLVPKKKLAPPPVNDDDEGLPV